MVQVELKGPRETGEGEGGVDRSLRLRDKKTGAHNPMAGLHENLLVTLLKISSLL